MSLCSCFVFLHLVINILCSCARAALMKRPFLTFLFSISPTFLCRVFVGRVMTYGSDYSSSLHRRCDDSRVMPQIGDTPGRQTLISSDWRSPPCFITIAMLMLSGTWPHFRMRKKEDTVDAFDAHF